MLPSLSAFSGWEIVAYQNHPDWPCESRDESIFNPAEGMFDYSTSYEGMPFGSLVRGPAFPVGPRRVKQGGSSLSKSSYETEL